MDVRITWGGGVIIPCGRPLHGICNERAEHAPPSSTVEKRQKHATIFPREAKALV